MNDNLFEIVAETEEKTKIMVYANHKGTIFLIRHGHQLMITDEKEVVSYLRKTALSIKKPIGTIMGHPMTLKEGDYFIIYSKIMNDTMAKVKKVEQLEKEVMIETAEKNRN